MTVKIMKPALKVGRVILIIALLVLLLFNLLGIVQRVLFKIQIPLVFGFGNAVIVTGSMEPTIVPGDIVLIQKRQNYAVGDIVTYQSASPITHRIVEKTESGYITQGDANNTRDDEIASSRIIGKVVKIIPKAGNVVLFLQNPGYLLILLLILISIFELPRLFKK